jgi:hypothetical protein
MCGQLSSATACIASMKMEQSGSGPALWWRMKGYSSFEDNRKTSPDICGGTMRFGSADMLGSTDG